MKIGLLWYDVDENLEERVGRAAARYRKKFGREANVCYVHPSENGRERRVGDVVVLSGVPVLRGHYWIGCEEKGKKGDGSREVDSSTRFARSE